DVQREAGFDALEYLFQRVSGIESHGRAGHLTRRRRTGHEQEREKYRRRCRADLHASLSLRVVRTAHFGTLLWLRQTEPVAERILEHGLDAIELILRRRRELHTESLQLFIG